MQPKITTRVLLSFLLPPLGLVFFLVDWPRGPHRARGTGLGMLCGAVLWAVVLVVIPFLNHLRADSQRMVCVGQLNGVNAALQMYIQDHYGRLPDLSSPAKLQADLEPYLGYTSAFTCTQGGPYVGNAAYSHRRLKDIANPAAVPLISDARHPHAEGRNALYADGIVRWGQ